MLKYTLGGLVAIGVIAAAAFFILARFNGSDAEAGPVTVITVRTTADAVTPAHLDLTAGRLVQIDFIDNADGPRQLTTDAGGAEQLPVSSRPFDAHSTGEPQPGVNIGTGAGQTASMLVRFDARGSFELHVQPLGHDEVLQTIAVEVR